MSTADAIREFAYRQFVQPARQSKHSSVSIAARDVHEGLGLSSAFPNVCQTLKGSKFLELHGLSDPVVIGPDPSSTTIFVYRL